MEKEERKWLIFHGFVIRQTILRTIVKESEAVWERGEKRLKLVSTKLMNRRLKRTFHIEKYTSSRCFSSKWKEKWWRVLICRENVFLSFFILSTLLFDGIRCMSNQNDWILIVIKSNANRSNNLSCIRRAFTTLLLLPFEYFENHLWSRFQEN